jgi:hypothetical protein
LNPFHPFPVAILPACPFHPLHMFDCPLKLKHAPV